MNKTDSIISAILKEQPYDAEEMLERLCKEYGLDLLTTKNNVFRKISSCLHCGDFFLYNHHTGSNICEACEEWEKIGE